MKTHYDDMFTILVSSLSFLYFLEDFLLFYFWREKGQGIEKIACEKIETLCSIRTNFIILYRSYLVGRLERMTARGHLSLQY